MDLGRTQVGNSVYPEAEETREGPILGYSKKVGIKGIINNTGL